jgi:hypothetical protein
MFIKSCFILFFIFLGVHNANSQAVRQESVNANERPEGLDRYLKIYTSGKNFNVKFKNENLSFSDSAHLVSFMKKNLKKINNKVAIQVNEKTNAVLYRMAVHAVDDLKIYSFRIFE